MKDFIKKFLNKMIIGGTILALMFMIANIWDILMMFSVWGKITLGVGLLAIVTYESLTDKK